ncbi:MAG: Rne/Rng family ribonuclease [Rhodobacteraceae bacterium]|nr:Rne/Rng family ribonuclease [Paracoccaceae bacterium]
MVKKMLIDATHAEETRVVVVDGNKVEEFDFESENKRQLAGNIYLAKVTRVEPSLQAAFVDYGGNRHGFLAFSEIHPDYYQIPVADREALMAEERAFDEQQRDEEDREEQPKKGRSRRSRSRGRVRSKQTTDAVTAVERDLTGMETIDLDDDAQAQTIAATVQSDDLVVSSDVIESDADTAADAADAHEHVDPAQDEHRAADDEDGATDEAPEAETSDEDDHHHDAYDKDDAEADEDDAINDEIENISDDDDALDLRPKRAPRPRRYKIQEVIKVRQIMLVQVVKEERGNKGAALTTYLSLAGRYCVLMPNTARGGGISRKITNAVDRKKIKEIANSIDVPQGAGLIVRTAGAKRTKTEIKRDYEYLQRMWEQIRELTLKSIAPAKIYEEGDLIKRSIRDLYNRDIDEVLVEGERGYRNAKDFMKMIMPSHAKNVKHYQDQLPLFARFQVESYLSSMFNPVVQLKSGGYLVIGVTEALVAVDVNSGRATKEGSIEETALKTNLEAAEEVARQLRLRDLAGLIVIDFIDMDERRNNAAVEKRLKDKLKTDRARIQVGRISGFGLLEMSRQRLRPGMIEATTQPCAHCHGTGLIRSDDNLALSILRQIEEEGVRRRSREVLVKCPVGIANYIMNQKRDHVTNIELRYGLSVRVEGDPMLISPDFSLEKFKTATRIVPEAVAPVISADASLMDQIDEDVEDEIEEDIIDEVEEEEERKPKKRRRRRRRRKGQSSDTDTATETDADNDADVDADAEAQSDNAGDASQDALDSGAQAEETPAPAADAKPKKRSRSRKKPVAAPVDQDVVESVEISADEIIEDEAPKPKRTRVRKPKAAAADAETVAEAASVDDAAKKPVRKRAPRKTKAQKDAEIAAETETATETVTEQASEPVAEAVADPVPTEVAQSAPEPVAEAAPEPVAEVIPDPVQQPAPKPKAEDPSKPKRRGWWSLGR